MAIQCEALTKTGVRCRRKTTRANHFCSLHQPSITKDPDQPEPNRSPEIIQSEPPSSVATEQAVIPRMIRDLSVGALGSLVATTLGKLSGLNDWLDTVVESGGTGDPAPRESEADKNSAALCPCNLDAKFTSEWLLMRWDAVRGANAYWLEWWYRKKSMTKWMYGTGPYTELPRTECLLSLRALRSYDCRQICWRVRAVFFPLGARREWRHEPKYGLFSEPFYLEIPAAPRVLHP